MGVASSEIRMGVRFEKSLWEPEVLKVHTFFTELLSMDLSI